MDDQTPLLIYRRRRVPPRGTTWQRFFMMALSSLLIWSVISIVFSGLFGLGDCVMPFRTAPEHGNMTQAELKKILLDTPSADKAAEWSRYYTSGPHLTGKNESLARWTAQKWEEFGVPSHLVSYDVYINYPVDHRLALLKSSMTAAAKDPKWSVAFEAKLSEPVLEQDPTSGLPDRIPTFHGYSASGNVTGQFVYVNYGTFQDFEDLVRANVTLEGKIAVARYGLIFRGLKVKRAQELGMIGVVLYTDPGDDGEITEANGYKAYPHGPARHPDSVQRGSVQFLSISPGDPTTPGYPSKPGATRMSTDHVLPKIPSIPISFTDALPILKALNGHGARSSDFGAMWTRGQGLKHKGVEYNVGPSPKNMVLNLYNEQKYVTTPLWNVIGVINGTSPNDVVVVGNHRDAWIAGGAGDPNSGSSAMMETIRSFGEALQKGWKPRRTIVFASWDGEEYALIGSTEWVEEFLPWIQDANVAYINCDVGISGPQFDVAAAPLLVDVLRDVTREVLSPNQTVANQTVYDLWGGHTSVIGSGSDFTAFQDYAGVPCLDMGFKQSRNSAVYQYHSNYDSYHWMEQFGDRGFRYHRTMAQILGLVTARVADSPVIPMNATEYADALLVYLKGAQQKLNRAINSTGTVTSSNDPADWEEDASQYFRRSSSLSAAAEGKNSTGELVKALKTIEKEIALFREKTVALDKEASKLRRKSADDGNPDSIPWWKVPEWMKMLADIARVNRKYKYLERNFLFAKGLDGRNWFKHVVFAPGLWTGYSGATYPGIVENIDVKDYASGVCWAHIIAGCVRNATKSIS